jgi:hypothetical protein
MISNNRSFRSADCAPRNALRWFQAIIPVRKVIRVEVYPVNIPSLVRSLRKKFFGGATPRRKPFRRSRGLQVEALEARDVPAALPPAITAVSPANLSTFPNANPTLQITFSEAMNAADVQQVANYALYSASGAPVKINSVAYNPGTFTATVNYNFGNTLLSGTYTLFVKGDHIHDAGNAFTISPPGQLVSADLKHGTVSTLNAFNAPTGNGNLYGAPQSYPLLTSESAVAVTVADFNNDGLNDIAVADQKNDKVYVFLGKSNGGFDTVPDATLNLPTGALSKAPGGTVSPEILTTGHVAGNPLLPDIVVADPGTNQVTIFLNQTTASGLAFSSGAGTTYIAGTDPVAVAVGDFNGDGKLEIAAADGRLSPQGFFDVTVLTNNSGGTFSGTATFHTKLVNLTGIAAGDLSDATVGPRAVPDLVISGANGLEALLNVSTPGTLAFDTTPAAFGGGASFNSVALGDLTSAGSTQLDVGAITTGASGNLFEAFANQGGGTSFSNKANVPLAGPATSVVLQDLNGDGLADPVMASPGSNAFTVLVNTTAGSVTFAGPTNYHVDNGPDAVAVADLNGDGTPDVVTANNVAPSYSVTLGNGDGTFAVPTTVTEAGTPNPGAIAVGDLNGDGLNDYVVLDTNSNQVEVYLATAPGVYAPPVAYSTLDGSGHGLKPVGVTLANLTGKFYANGLPILDIVTADATPDGSGKYYVSVLPNKGDGSGTVGAASTFAVGQSPTAVAAGLFRTTGGKKAQDLIVAHNGTSTSPLARGVTVLVNTTAAAGPIAFAAGTEVATPANVAVSFAPTALAVGDFNADGKQDFVILNSSIAPSVDLFEGNGAGGFTKVGSFGLNQNLTPSAMVVGDLNNDGYPDVAVVASKTADLGHAVIESLINSLGGGPNTTGSAGGFGNVVLSPGLPYGVTGNSVALVHTEDSPFPSLVLGTVQATSKAAPALTVSNLFVLQGVGDGKFINGVPYEVAGEPSTTSVAVTSDPMIPVVTFFKTGQLATADLVVNGNFDKTELTGETGNLDGWQTASLPDSFGQWLAMQTGGFGGTALSPLSRTAVPNPPAGLEFEAMLDQWNIVPVGGFFQGNDTPATFAGSNFLYQDITIPASATSANLTLTLFLDNMAKGWFNGNPGDPLNYNLPDTKDQQVAVDIVDPTQNVTFAPSQLSIFDTTSTTPLVTTLTLSGNLIAFRGKTIRLRIAGVDNQGQLIVGVDSVHLQTTFTDSTPPTLSNLRVRNPGQTITVGGLHNVAVTTDPTIVGRVGDSGGVGAVAFVEIDPNNAGFLSSNVIRINPSQFDAQGNFQVTIPNLSAGLHIIGVRVHGVSGLTFTLTLPMIFQGLSNSTVQAVGPSGNAGGISTAGMPDVVYTSVSGRITATAADPTDPSGNTIYAGSQNGGVWKSTDGGANWTPLTDFVSDQSGNPINVPVGAIAVAKTSPKTVYVATGDGNDLPDTLGGIGVLKSLDGGVTWAVVGNSPTILANARVTAMAVDPNNANIVYVAVASGGQGPGVYRTLDGGQTWTNILSTANMATWGKSGTTLANDFPSVQLGSVTSLVLNPFNSNHLTIGIGNIGMLGSGTANASPTAGVWISANANSPSGVSWTSVLGGNDTRFVGTNNNVPTPTNFLPGGPTTGLTFSQWPGLTADPAGNGTQLGRVTVAEGFGRGPNQETFYVLMGTVATSTPPLTGGNVNFGNGTGFGLYKSSDGGLNWTHVRLRDQTNFQVDSNGVASPIYSDLNLLGHDAANGASMAVDKTDPNVVYIGGTVAYDPTDHAAHGMIAVDTGDMLDATDDGFLAARLIVQEDNAWGGSLVLSDILNNSDDIIKSFTAYSATFKDIYDIAALGGTGSFAYDGNGNIFEGVSWFDIATNEYDPFWELDPTFGENWGISGQLPSEVLSMTVDPQGRILVGTEKGLFRVVNRGIGYDYTTGGAGNILGGPAFAVGFEGIVAELAALGDPTAPGAPPPANVTVTNLNANLQVADVTSVAVDPYLAGVYYIGTQGSGTARTASPGSLSWQTMGMTGPIGQTTSTAGPVLAPLGPNGVEDSSAVLVGARDPNAAPGTPATVYSHYAFLFGKDFVPLFSTQGGELGTFQEKFAGIDTTDHGGYLPLMIIDPTKILDNGQFQDELIYGTDQVYSTRTNSNLWLNLDGGHPLADPGQLISAAAIAPSNSDFIYVGTSNGKVFVTQNSGADFWPEKDSGLPTGEPVSSFAVNPTNPLIAYITFSGFGAFPHMWTTSDGGNTWTSIQGNLPMVQVFSFVTDPRPAAGAPNGFLYAGTQVGLFDSTDGGKTWTKLGSGLPNVPVVSMNFNAGTNQLVIGTQGRGVFVISTDRVGPSVVSVSPSQPVNIGTVNSITVTFNEPILDSSFTTAQVKITGPGGINIPVTSITDISVTPLGQTNPHNVFQILFPTLTLDGGYTITIGPNITDLTGNPMDQNHNLINGQPGVAPVGDAFQFQIAVNTTDDGRFISGLFNDILGHPASSNAFLTYLPGIDAGRAAALANLASAYVMGGGARGQLVTELFSSTATPSSTLGIGNLNGSTITPTDVNFWVNQLRAGMPVETLIDAIVAGSTYFTQTRAGHNVNGIDSNWVNQLFLDLLGRNPSPAEFNGDVNLLVGKETAARQGLTNALVAGQAYLTQYITQGAGPFQGTLDFAQGYLGILGRGPNPTELGNWIKAFQAGATDQQFIATLMGTSEFFKRAPSIVQFFAPLDPDGAGGPSLRAFVKAAFYELFPNQTPPASLVASFVAKMQAGMTQAQVAANLMGLDGYLFDPVNGVVAQYYSFYLGRVAKPSEVNAWRPFFAAGGRVEGVLAGLVASAEYFNNHSPAGTPLPTMDANWLKAAYDQITGFDPSSGQQSSGLAALAGAESAARRAIGAGITASGAYRQHLVTLIYSNILHRAPNPTELVNGVNLLSLPSSGPGTLSRDEQLIASLLGSQEYFFDQSDATGLHTNVTWVDSLYPALQLPFDPAGATASVNRLLNLYAPQRLAVINAILSSTEYRTNVITKAFGFLGRPPSPSEVSTWLRNLAAGMTYEQMVATLMGTPEYFAHAPSVVGLVNPSNDAFVRAVFKQLIPFANTTDSDVNFWVNQIQRGLITRTGFALKVITGPVYRFDPTNGLVNQLFLKYLGRSATTQDNQNAARLFAAGGTDEQLIGSLLDSIEYFERTHPFP